MRQLCLQFEDERAVFHIHAARKNDSQLEILTSKCFLFQKVTCQNFIVYSQNSKQKQTTSAEVNFTYHETHRPS